MALRDIKAGEELFHNYGDAYWLQAEEMPADQRPVISVSEAAYRIEHQ